MNLEYALMFYIKMTALHLLFGKFYLQTGVHMNFYFIVAS